MPAIGRGVLDLLKGGLSFEPPTVPGRPPTFLHELVPYLSGSAAVLRTKVGALGGSAWSSQRFNRSRWRFLVRELPPRFIGSGERA